MPTPPSAIPAISPPPSISAPGNFDALADASWNSLPAAIAGMNAAATNVYNNAVEVANNAAAVATNASSAQTNAGVASTAAGATVWVSGTTYAIGDVRYSPANGRTYRRKTAGAGTTDPSADAANWLLVSPLLAGTTELRSTAAISAGSLTLDMLNGVTGVALNANITSITLNNNQASASVCHCHTLELTADGTARTVAWPAGDGSTTLLFRWAGGVAPTLTSTNGKRDTFFLKSVSQFLFDAYVVGQNL